MVFRRAWQKRRGLVHDDTKRHIEVLIVGRDLIGVRLHSKEKDGIKVQFAMSRKGSRVFARLLGLVLRGKVKTWREQKWVHELSHSYVVIRETKKKR